MFLYAIECFSSAAVPCGLELPFAEMCSVRKAGKVRLRARSSLLRVSINHMMLS